MPRHVEHQARRRPSARRGWCPRPAGRPGRRGAAAVHGRGDVVGVPGKGDAERADRVHARVAREQVAGVVVEARPRRRGHAEQRSDPGSARHGRRGPAGVDCGHSFSSRSRRRSTPVGSIGTPARRRPICTPASVPGEHQVVEVAEVPDAEDPAGQLAEPGAQRHVEAVEHQRADLVGVVALGDEDRRQRPRVLALVGAEHLEAPGRARPRGSPAAWR